MKQLRQLVPVIKQGIHDSRTAVVIQHRFAIGEFVGKMFDMTADTAVRIQGIGMILTTIDPVPVFKSPHGVTKHCGSHFISAGKTVDSAHRDPPSIVIVSMKLEKL
jgi:hypothetical protein